MPQSEIIDVSERRFNVVAPNRNRAISSNSDMRRLRTEMAAPEPLPWSWLAGPWVGHLQGPRLCDILSKELWQSLDKILALREVDDSVGMGK